MCYKPIDLVHITWILERFCKALEKQSAVVEAARKWKEAQSFEEGFRLLDELSVALGVLEEK